MKKIELLELITDQAREYRLECLESINRNKHLCGNNIEIGKLPQPIIDAILVDFINAIGAKQGVDYALSTKDL